MEFERHANCASHEWVSDDPWSRGGRGRPKEEGEPAVDGGGSPCVLQPVVVVS